MYRDQPCMASSTWWLDLRGEIATVTGSSLPWRHSFYFLLFLIVMIDGSDFQVPWVTPLARLFWIKVFKKILNAPSQWLLFLLFANYTCSGNNSHKLYINFFIKLCEIYTYAFHVLVINKSLILFSLPDNSESFIRFI